MDKSITFRLLGKKKPTSWSLSGGTAIKEGSGLKYINYYPGSDSIFVEDNQGSARPPKKVYFENNDTLSDPATEIVVSESNKVLIKYLTSHPYYQIHYAIHNEEVLSEKKVESYDKIEKALLMIKASTDVEIQAKALSILGIESFGWSAVKCNAALKEKAITSPSVIITELESSNYESKYLSALAFFSGIVKENNLNNAIVWNDKNQGVIIHLAKGEYGIGKFADLLNVDTEQSRLVLQEIGIRLDKVNKEAESKSDIGILTKDNSDAKKLLSEKDIKIAELEARLNAMYADDVDDVDEQEISLEDAQKAYLEKFKKEAPVNKKNDLNWIIDKISE